MLSFAIKFGLGMGIESVGYFLFVANCFSFDFLSIAT